MQNKVIVVSALNSAELVAETAKDVKYFRLGPSTIRALKIILGLSGIDFV